MSDTQIAYVGEVREVFSGDDLVILVDLKVEDLWKRQRVRLHGVDTPNAVNAGAGTEAGKLRTYVRNLVKGRRVQVTIISKINNSWVAIVNVETPEGLHNLNDDLIGQGYRYQQR
jgi:endonuclease YncB( thermonuclease family)